MSKDHNEDGEKRPFDKRGKNRDQDNKTGGGAGFKPRERERGARDYHQRDGKSRFGKGNAPRGKVIADEVAANEVAANEVAERIAKRLARAGIASRREAETMIAAGRISVNGKVLTTPAFNVNRGDIIKVDGQLLPQTERTRLWLYHKPAGLVTTNRDPEGRPTVFEALPEDMPRVLSVGRLDINTEGLLLLTNDGGLSRILELPTTGWLRRYRVRAHGSVKQEQLDELKNGIAVDGIFYGSVDAQLERQQGSNVWLNIGLREGKNREVKNILGALGLTVGRLIRVSFGPFQLADLQVGAVREIRGRTLRDQLGERLVQESGADFDAPIINEFSNSAVRGTAVRAARSDDTQEERSRRPREWISSSPSRSKPKPTARVEESRRQRGVNVWMAPGARPQSAKAEVREERKDYPKRTRKPFDEARGEVSEREDKRRRPFDREHRSRFDGEEKKRPGRRERERENTRNSRSFADKSGGDKSSTDKFANERPRGAKPYRDRPSGGRPSGGGNRPAGKPGGRGADRRR